MSDVCKVWCGCIISKNNNDPCDGCCGVFTCRVYPEYEYQVLKRYDEWRTNEVSVQREAALSLANLGVVESTIRQGQEKVEDIDKKLRDTNPEKTSIQRRLEAEMRQTKDNLVKADTEKNKLLKNEKLVAWRKSQKEGEYLRNYRDGITKRRIEEKVIFYLHATNHMLFAVTILNTLTLAIGSIKAKHENN